MSNFKKKVYKGCIETSFRWLVPFLIGVSRNNVDNKANVYALHLTPFLEIGFNWKGTRNGFKKEETNKD